MGFFSEWSLYCIHHMIKLKSLNHSQPFSQTWFSCQIKYTCATSTSLVPVYMIPEWNFIQEQEFHQNELIPEWLEQQLHVASVSSKQIQRNNMEIEWTHSRIKVILASSE